MGGGAGRVRGGGGGGPADTHVHALTGVLLTGVLVGAEYTLGSLSAGRVGRGGDANRAGVELV